MIDWERFKLAMLHIGKRTASTPDTETLTMMYQYLSPQLTTEEFLAAARNVWKTATFFPAPVAFLETRCRAEWLEVMALISDFRPPNTADDWHERWLSLSEAARSAIKGLGGPLAFKEQVFNKSITRAKEKFFAEYIEAIAAQDDDVALEAGAKPAQLGSGCEEELGLPLGWEGIEAVE